MDGALFSYTGSPGSRVVAAGGVEIGKLEDLRWLVTRYRVLVVGVPLSYQSYIHFLGLLMSPMDLEFVLYGTYES